MEKVLNYLKEQKAEREELLHNYGVVKSAYEAAKARLDSFGDISGVEAEVVKLEEYIEAVEAKIACTNYEAVEAVEEGGANGDVTEENA